MDEEKWKQFKTAIAAPQQEPRWVKDDKGWWYRTPIESGQRVSGG